MDSKRRTGIKVQEDNLLEDFNFPEMSIPESLYKVCLAGLNFGGGSESGGDNIIKWWPLC